MPGARRRIPTGVSIALPADGWAAFVFARSGLADREGICLANGVGVIDADYRGEIQVSLVNLSSRAAVIEPGQRIAQLAVMPVERWRSSRVSSWMRPAGAPAGSAPPGGRRGLPCHGNSRTCSSSSSAR